MLHRDEMVRRATTCGDRTTLAGAARTLAWLAITLVVSSVAACAAPVPADGTRPCRLQADCVAGVPFCRCDGRCWASPTAQPDAGATDAGVAPTRTYVVALLRTFPSDPSQGFGVDLDMRVSGQVGTCTDQLDVVSPEGEGAGIDDQLLGALATLSALLGGDGWDGALAEPIAVGTQVLALEVSPVAGDACARRVHAWTAHVASAGVPDVDPTCAAVPERSACESITDGVCRWANTDGVCSGIAPRQAWIADEDLGEVSATLVAGRLRTAPFARIPLAPWIIPSGLAPIDLHDVVVEADLRDTVLTRGELGGAVHVADAVAWMNEYIVPYLYPGAPAADPSTLTVLGSDPDLAPSADGMTCADVSAGFGFTAIEATVMR